jgi:hypothetical protein
VSNGTSLRGPFHPGFCAVLPWPDTLVISNPTLYEQPFWIEGDGIVAVAELPLNQSEKTAVGYLPDGYQSVDVGQTTATTIAGGDTRVFVVTTTGESGSPLPTVQPTPRPRHVAVNIFTPKQGSLTNTLRTMPVLPQFVDAVVIDWSYVNRSTVDALTADSAELHALVRHSVLCSLS